MNDECTAIEECPVLCKSDAPGYKLLDVPLPWPPLKDGMRKEDLPEEIIRAVDLLCRIPNTHIATLDFLVEVSGVPKGKMWTWLDEAAEHGLTAAQICSIGESDIGLLVYRLADRMLNTILRNRTTFLSPAAHEEVNELIRRSEERLRAEAVYES